MEENVGTSSHLRCASIDNKQPEIQRREQQAATTRLERHLSRAASRRKTFSRLTSFIGNESDVVGPERGLHRSISR